MARAWGSPPTEQGAALARALLPRTGCPLLQGIRMLPWSSCSECGSSWVVSPTALHSSGCRAARAAAAATAGEAPQARSAAEGWVAAQCLSWMAPSMPSSRQLLHWCSARVLALHSLPAAGCRTECCALGADCFDGTHPVHVIPHVTDIVSHGQHELVLFPRTAMVYVDKANLEKR